MTLKQKFLASLLWAGSVSMASAMDTNDMGLNNLFNDDPNHLLILRQIKLEEEQKKVKKDFQKAIQQPGLRKISELTNTLINLNESLQKGRITLETYQKKKKEYNTEILACTDAFKNHSLAESILRFHPSALSGEQVVSAYLKSQKSEKADFLNVLYLAYQKLPQNLRDALRRYIILDSTRKLRKFQKTWSCVGRMMKSDDVKAHEAMKESYARAFPQILSSRRLCKKLGYGSFELGRYEPLESNKNSRRNRLSMLEEFLETAKSSELEYDPSLKQIQDDREKCMRKNIKHPNRSKKLRGLGGKSKAFKRLLRYTKGK